MYLAHFGFTHYPFDRALQPDELLASSAGREAQARLHHLIELRGIGLITGEVGSGKTSVCRQLGAALHPGLYRLFYVPLSTGNVLDMYKAIAWQLGLPIERSRATAYHAIHTEVSRLTLETKIYPVLVVDEAQHLRNEVLEDLRLLTNYAMDAERYPDTATGGPALLIRPAISAFPERVVGSACASSFSRLARRSLALPPIRGSLYPEASASSSPP